jgi:hypothetical protein
MGTSMSTSMGWKKRGVFSMVPHIIHPSLCIIRMDGVVGWWVLIHSGHTSKLIWFEVFASHYYSASHELVGARKETKLLVKNLQQQQQQQDIHKTFIDTKVEFVERMEWEGRITKNVSMKLICWGSLE